MLKQKTINKIVCFQSMGLHSGKITNIILRPADPNIGIVINNLKLSPIFITDTTGMTTHGDVSQTEHLLSALYALHIDNIYIELDLKEMPIMDGSSESFVFMAECAGVKTQNATREYIEITKKIRIEDNDSFIELLPSEDF